MTQVPSQLIVNFDDMLDDLNSRLESEATWTSLRTAATGQALMRFLSAVGANGRLATARALQERYFDTMRSPTSVYRATRTLGVHIQRRRPGSTPVQLTRTDIVDSLTIPSYSQFSCDGQQFFNRNDIRFTIGQSVANVTLYSGQVNSTAFVSDGSADRKSVV